MKGALDTLNAALHLWMSSRLQHPAKSRTNEEAAEERPLLFSSHIYGHEICSNCRVLRPSVCVRVTHSLHAWEMCGGTVYLQSMIIVRVSLSLASWKGGWPHTSMKRITPRLQISADTHTHTIDICSEPVMQVRHGRRSFKAAQPQKLNRYKKTELQREAHVSFLLSDLDM